VTTVVVVKKAGQVAIAADTLVTFGDTRLSHRHEANSKLFKVDTPAGPSWVGMAGTVAHFPVLRKAMNALPKDQLLLGSRDEVFDTFVRLHPLLKETFFLQTKEDDNDPYESSQFSVVMANASGIFGLYSYREVFEFKEFWGIGSGRGFALGPCTRSGTRPARPVKWRWPACMPAANSTETPPDRWTCTRSN
jgi:ATP-dependent HslUV protease subunit HslV